MSSQALKIVTENVRDVVVLLVCTCDGRSDGANGRRQAIMAGSHHPLKLGKPSLKVLNLKFGCAPSVISVWRRTLCMWNRVSQEKCHLGKGTKNILQGSINSVFERLVMSFFPTTATSGGSTEPSQARGGSHGNQQVKHEAAHTKGAAHTKKRKYIYICGRDFY